MNFRFIPIVTPHSSIGISLNVNLFFLPRFSTNVLLFTSSAKLMDGRDEFDGEYVAYKAETDLSVKLSYKADVDYSRGKDLDEMYEAELFAYPLLTETFDGADYYGSDFDKILEIEYELLSDNGLEPVASLRIYPSENLSCDPDHLKIDNLDLFQDDDDWTEYWSKVDALREIHFCHSLHHMSDHQNLPLVDILHKTSFSIDIKHEITFSQG